MKTKNGIQAVVLIMIFGLLCFNCNRENPVEPSRPISNDLQPTPLSKDSPNSIQCSKGKIRLFESFPLNFEGMDRLTAGDVDRDGKAEIVHGDRGDWIRIFKRKDANNWPTLRSFPLNFERSDDLAMGDVDGDHQNDDIVHADRNDWIRTYNMLGSKLREFKVNFDGADEGMRDRIAIGDVDNDRIDEIIHAQDKSNSISIYNMYGSKKGGFYLDFKKGDGLASGDIDGDGVDEIIHGYSDKWGGQIKCYDRQGMRRCGFGVHFRDMDGLAVGNVIKDIGTTKEEIIQASQDNYIRVYDKNGVLLVEFPRPVWSGDAVTTGDIDGDGIEEIIYGDADDWIYIFGVER